MIGPGEPGIAPRKRVAHARKTPAGQVGGAAFDGVFRDGKDADALRTIGEVARALGMRQHVLRYWEEQFPMLRPLTRAGGRRYYRPEDIALLLQINRLVHHQGYTLRGARLALSAVNLSADTDEPEMAIVEAMAILRAHLAAIRTRLAGALEPG